MGFITNNDYLMELLMSLSYIAVAIIVFAIGKKIYQLLYPSIQVNHELVLNDNLAFAISYVGYFVGLLIVIGAALIGGSINWLQDLMEIGYYSLIGILLLHFSVWINNKVIISEFNIKKEILEDRNLGTGYIEAAVFIATALILFGAISGESGGWLFGTFTALVYWGVGLLIMILVSKLYIKFVGYDVHQEIEKDNVAAGVALSGVIIAISVIVMNALLGDFESWITTLVDVLVQTVIGVIMLPIMRMVADKILLPGQRLTDEIVNQEEPNVGAALVEAFAYIGSAVLIAWSI